MDYLDDQALKALAEIRADICLSIYMPIQRKTTDYKKNSIRLKNLVRKAERRASEMGIEKQVASILDPVRRLVQDLDFWQQQENGLALLRSPETFFIYRLPLAFDEWTAVSQRFHLKPLFPLIGAGERFYVLALSQSEVRLFACSRYFFEPIDLGEAAKGVGANLDYDARQELLPFHLGASGAGSRPATFPGHGTGVDDTKNEIFRYFLSVDQKMTSLLPGQNPPLILAGVEFLLPIFRSASSYSNILDKYIAGNPEELSGAQLHKEAVTIMEPWFQRNRKAAEEQFENLLGTGLSSADLSTVVASCSSGRIQTLFFDQSAHCWGTFDEATGQVQVHAGEEAGDEELLDLAAVETFKRGGTVYPVPAGEVPGGQMVAAVFRY